MPLHSGPITRFGAVVDCLVGVPAERRALLEKLSLPVPPDVPVRALIDTGATMSMCSADVFRRLELTAIERVPIFTTSTRSDTPHSTELFQVSWVLTAGAERHPFEPSLRVLVADGFQSAERIDAIIGRDILARCGFQYWGPDGRFTLSF
jgi:Aspartyl protease